MFGYVKPHNPELRMRDYECYRAYYCGLCRAMGKCTGQCSRMTLSYDFVFLAAVRCYLAGEEPQIQKKRCLAHPLRRRKSVMNSPQLNYCADASALLSYQKCKDDLMDEDGWKKLRAVFMTLLLSSAYRRAAKRHPELDRAIAGELKKLQEYEKTEKEPSADVAASIFGNLMQEVCSHGLEGVPKKLAAEIGRTVGRWIYLTDAADDLADDRKKKRFNPYVHVFGDPPTEDDAQTLRVALKAILCETERAFLLMDEPPCPELKEIIANILYLGLPMAADRVLEVSFLSSEKNSKKEKTDEQSV